MDVMVFIMTSYILGRGNGLTNTAYFLPNLKFYITPSNNTVNDVQFYHTKRKTLLFLLLVAGVDLLLLFYMLL